jgi:hypothetical protein
MANLAVLEPPSPGEVIKSTLIKAVKTAVATFIGIMGTNALDYTNLTSLKAAGIAAAGAAGTVILNLILSWVNTP